MAACSFDMLFTYMVIGWEGAVHDVRVLTNVLEDPTSGFPHLPPGLYLDYILFVLHNYLSQCIVANCCLNSIVV